MPPDGLLDGHVGVGAVQVIQVDVVGAQGLQRTLDALAHIRRRAVQDGRAPVPRNADDAELCGQHDLIAAVRYGSADYFLAIAVAIRGVDERDAEVESAAD